MAEREAPIRLLMVDDEREFLVSSAQALGRRGVQVRMAFDGAAALRMVETEDFDVVLLDIKMPGIDGLQVLELIRKLHPHLGVVLLTGHPTVETAFAGMKLGADDFVVRPPDIENLTRAIRKAHQRRLEGIEEHRRRLVEEIREQMVD